VIDPGKDCDSLGFLVVAAGERMFTDWDIVLGVYTRNHHGPCKNSCVAGAVEEKTTCMMQAFAFDAPLEAGAP
jgi:hypothetical protein